MITIRIPVLGPRSARPHGRISKSLGPSSICVHEYELC